VETVNKLEEMDEKSWPFTEIKQDLFGEVYGQLLSTMDSGLLWHGYEERPTIAVKARKIQNAKRAKKQENFAQCVMSLKWRINCISF